MLDDPSGLTLRNADSVDLGGGPGTCIHVPFFFSFFSNIPEKNFLVSQGDSYLSENVAIKKGSEREYSLPS